MCPDVTVAMVFIERLIDFTSSGLGSKITLLYAIILGWIMNLYGSDFYSAITTQTTKRSLLFQSALLLILLITLLLLRPGGVAPTLYFQF